MLRPVDGPRQRLGGLIPLEVRVACLTRNVAEGLAVVLHELERAVLARIDLHLQGAAWQGVGVLNDGRQGEHSARTHEGRHLVQAPILAKATAAAEQKSGRRIRGEQVPLALWQVDVSQIVLLDDGRHKDVPVHPLRGDVSSEGVVGELHDEGPDPKVLRPVLCVRKRVMVRDEPVAQLEGLPNGSRGIIAPKPWKMRNRIDDRMHPHDRHEDADLDPAGQVNRGSVPQEAANVACHIRSTTEHPIQHHAGGALQVLPRRIDISGPGGGAHAGHAGRPAAVQRVEAPVRVLGPQSIQLCNIPPVVGEVVRLPFVVPPEGHPVLHQPCDLLTVPLPHLGNGVVQVSLHRVGVENVWRETT
mmetsp:Transcript_104434/g.265071  ORF Transcript_104434/g.265071 Transcript_104434/m.265071 type:complete len:359 (+) Transcript_104434:492-1568(+)